MAGINYLQFHTPAKELDGEEARNGFHNKARGIGKFIYAIRFIGAYFFALITFSYHYYTGYFGMLEYVLIAVLMVWPHISFLTYKYFQSNKKVELRSEILDSFLAGLVAYSVDFALFPAFVVITVTVASNMAINGIRHFLISILAVLIGINIPSLLWGIYFSTESPVVLNVFCSILLFSHFNLSSYIAFTRNGLLKKAQRSVREQKEELAREKQKSDELLLNILPAETAAELKRYGKASPKSYDKVTVLFSDFQHFTHIAENLTPSELVNEIDLCFREFDRIIEKYNIEKIKTIGDAYLCVSGLPSPNKNHALEITKAALEIQDFLSDLKENRKNSDGSFFEARIGIHTGPVVAGIVGIKKFAYDIWGDTVNTAARMEQSGEVGKVNISADTYELIKDYFECTPRGKIAAKNKGEIDMFFVKEIKTDYYRRMGEHSISNNMNFKAAKENILQKLGDELPRDLSYHGIHHTLDVYDAAVRLAEEEKIEGEDLFLIKTAALFHDCGFLRTYKGHEQASCLIAREILPQHQYTDEQIDKICGMIMATKLPQSPKNKAEEILCDADLDYLGRNDFYTIGESLFREFTNYNIIDNEEKWHSLQLSFLKGHSFFTETARRTRRAKKEAYIRELEENTPVL